MANEIIEHPEFYGGDGEFETIKAWNDWGFGYEACMALGLKHVTRRGRKDGTTFLGDARKARQYLRRACRMTPTKAHTNVRMSPSDYCKAHDITGELAEVVKCIRQSEPRVALIHLDAAIAEHTGAPVESEPVAPEHEAIRSGMLPPGTPQEKLDAHDAKRAAERKKQEAAAKSKKTKSKK